MTKLSSKIGKGKINHSYLSLSFAKNCWLSKKVVLKAAIKSSQLMVNWDMRKFWSSTFEALLNRYLLLTLDRFITYVYDLLFEWIARRGPLTPNNFTNHYRAGGTKERKILCSCISKITLVCFLLRFKISYFSFLKSNDIWFKKDLCNKFK